MRIKKIKNQSVVDFDPEPDDLIYDIFDYPPVYPAL